MVATAGGQGTGVAEVAVDAGGAVKWFESPSGEGDYVSLSGVVFATD